ncbi:phosphodiesterase [Alicyclobacillus acidoterrestris]|uniref:HD-GYP domain-containing protein n=1 Tax=Alicyclobacillus suci TaxID=2816080 RepID=UPI00119750AA|nr:HD-GYP domain-containing protein [Alicyclobacillus suci]GEO26324.1 phosphodiesterase [Alicyclobacillus acidoterrestris]
MRWVALKYIKPGAVLAQRVADGRGRTLLARGIVLTDSLIMRLKRVGIRAVCIENAGTEDVVVTEMVEEQTKIEILSMTYETLAALSSSTSFSYKVKPTFLRSQFGPLLSEIIHQLRQHNGAGEQLGSVYLSDGELFHHSVNVTFYALTLGLQQQMSETDLIDLGIGTLLHDVGKMRIPQDILRKPGRLSHAEYRTVQLHAQFGYDILKDIRDISTKSSLVALQHHERLDGSGYPWGLKAPEIHPFAQLTAVADVYEALTANRVYRQAYLPHEAYDILLADKGTKLSSAVIDAFAQTISIYPIGMSVRLSNGDGAVVIKPSADNRQVPIVRAIENERGEPIRPYELNLATASDIHIVTCES